MKIIVRNNDVGKALRILKKKLYNEGETREVRDRQHFISAGEQRRLAKKAGEKRWHKKREKIEQNLIRLEQNQLKQNRKKQNSNNNKNQVANR